MFQNPDHTKNIDRSFLSKQEQQVLVNQVIDEERPGTILKDFQTLVDFVGNSSLTLSERFNLLPIDSVVMLNDQLAHPIKVALRRPQQKSYPNINGLYLILRTLGMGMVTLKGRKYHLSLDEVVMDSFNSLNATERYFTLLEAWLLHSRFQIIGEDRCPYRLLNRCLDFLDRVTDQGLPLIDNKQLNINYFPGTINLALMQIFGLIALEHLDPPMGKGWTLKQASRLPWGDVILKYLYQISYSHETDEDVLRFIIFHREENMNPLFGEWQKSLQPFFPMWRNNLTLPQHQFRDGSYIFKVSLGKVWRKIVIPAKSVLDELGYAILDAFEFEDTDHLYRFLYKDRFGCMAVITHPYMNEPPFTSEVQIGDLPIEVCTVLIYNFDFGDNWEFEMLLEQIDPVDTTLKQPKLIGSYGKAPEQYPN